MNIISSLVALVTRQAQESGHAHDVPESSMYLSAVERTSLKETKTMAEKCVALNQDGSRCKNAAVANGVCHVKRHKDLIPGLAPVAAVPQAKYDVVRRTNDGDLQTGSIEIYNTLQVAKYNGTPIAISRRQQKQRGADGKLRWGDRWEQPRLVVGARKSSAAMVGATGNDLLEVLFEGAKPVMFAHIQAILPVG